MGVATLWVDFSLTAAVDVGCSNSHRFRVFGFGFLSPTLPIFNLWLTRCFSRLVEFRTKSDAQRALTRLHETMLDGRRIYLKEVSKAFSLTDQNFEIG